MTTRRELQLALKDGNVKAFLRVIRAGESDQTENAYRKLVGDPPGVYSITDLSRHPNRVVWINRLHLASTAAGAYQFLNRTWSEIAHQYGFEDFGPQCQDEGAVALMARRKALDPIMNGDLHTTLLNCSYEWASLPPGRYGQGELSPEQVFDLYDKWGGKYFKDGDLP